jgi:hypothetical protein
MMNLGEVYKHVHACMNVAFGETLVVNKKWHGKKQQRHGGGGASLIFERGLVRSERFTAGSMQY